MATEKQQRLIYQEHPQWMLREINSYGGLSYLKINFFPFFGYDGRFPDELVTKFREQKEVKGVYMKSNEIDVQIYGGGIF